MDKQQLLVIFVILSSVLVTMMSQMPVSAAPTYSSTNYDNLRELYELLMGSQQLEDAYAPSNHRMIRKNSRSPSLRLRFGRRSDPSLYQAPIKEDESLPEVVRSEK